MMRKLQTRLILSHILPVLIIIPVLGAVLFYLLETRYYFKSIADALIDQSTLIAHFTEADSSMWTDTAKASSMATRLDPAVSARLMFIDKQGHLLASTLTTDANRVGTVIAMQVVTQALQGQANWLVLYNSYLQERIVDVALPVFDADQHVIGVIRLSHDLALIEQPLVLLGLIMFSTFFVATVLAAGIGVVLARSMSAPLSRLALAVQQLNTRQSFPPLPVTGAEEIQTLSHGVNELVGRLHQLEVERHQLVASLVHELGTPLGAIKAAAQAFQNGASLDPELSDDLATGISSQVDLLRLLLDDLTLLGESEMRNLTLNVQDVDLGEIIQSQCQMYAYLMLQKRIQISCQLPSQPFQIKGDPVRLNQIVANLLHNAYKYTPVNGAINITAMRKNRPAANASSSEIEIRISDTGPGIEVAEQDKIFQLFYRSPKVRSVQQGMGIGLALAQRLVNLHGGSLSVESTHGSRTVFIVNLPQDLK